MDAKRAVDWAAVRVDYEQGRGTVMEVAGRHGVPHQAIYERARQEGWMLRDPRKRKNGGAALTQKLRSLIGREITDLLGRLEDCDGDDGTRLKRIQATAQTLLKILDMENRQRAVAPAPTAAYIRQLDDAALEVICERLERMVLEQPPLQAPPGEAG